MGDAQHFQRGLFEELQNCPQDLPKDARAGNDIVVCAEDDRAFDEFDRQAVE